MFMPTLYLTEDYSLVRRDSEDTLLVQIPEKRAKDGATPSPARKEHIPLVKIDEVVVLGEVTLTASALHLLLERNIEITFLSHFGQLDRKSTRLNSSHVEISYAVFCLKKKKKNNKHT